MQIAKRAIARDVPVWALVVGGMALAVAFAVAAFLSVADTLPGDTLVAVRPIEVPSYGINHIHVWRAATDLERGFQLGVIALLFGGVPAAILGWALAARPSTRARPWSRAWGNVFLGGLVFQLSSLALTALLLVLLSWAVYEGDASARAILDSAAPLLFGNLCGFWGLRCWRVLQHQAQEMPLTIAPYGPA
jgi:hypothetical protein